MSIEALDQPVKPVVFRPLTLRRRIKNSVATTFFFTSFVVALIPLVWLLWVVIARGWFAVTRSGWWTHSLRGVLPSNSPVGCITPCTARWCRPGWPPCWPCRWA